MGYLFCILLMCLFRRNVKQLTRTESRDSPDQSNYTWISHRAQLYA